MTKMQKATESGTPENPTCDLGIEAVAGTASEISGRKNKVRKSSSRAFGADNFRSVAAGMIGAGVGACSLLLAHGQEDFPAQQSWVPAATLGQTDFVSAAAHGWIWESWITSPRNKPTMDLMTFTFVRVVQWAIIPIFFS